MTPGQRHMYYYIARKYGWEAAVDYLCLLIRLGLVKGGIPKDEGLPF